MIVLSLFDGISCARVALERAGIKVDAYYASEIDKYAIKVSQKNRDDVYHIGNVKDVSGLCGMLKTPRGFGQINSEPKTEDGIGISKIELLIGGSPCQDLSIAKKDRKGLDGEKSSLFREFDRVLKEVKPKRFIFENVASMPQDAKNMITETLGVEPIMIDAALVSAQSRKRRFRTNIPNVTLPEDKGISLQEKLHSGTAPRKKSLCIGANYQKMNMTNYEKGQGQMVIEGKNYRKLKPIECERLQGLPDQYSAGISNAQRYKCLGNAFNVDVIAHILSFIPKK